MDQTPISLITALNPILYNPYLLTIVGLGWVWVILSHFRLHHKLHDRIDLERTINRQSLEELTKDWRSSNEIAKKVDLKVYHEIQPRTNLIEYLVEKRISKLEKQIYGKTFSQKSNGDKI